MKKIKYIALCLLLLTATSCKKYLETSPTDFATPQNFYATESDLNTALAGIYDSFAQDGTYSRNLIVELAQGTDEGFRKRSTVTDIFVHKYNHTEGDVTVLNCWRQLYDGINRANLLLENIDKPTMDPVKRDNIKGQALFLRAYSYFLLVSLYGDVPLILESTKSADNVNRARTPSADVYAKVLTDMTTAEGLVSTFTHPGTVSKTAIEGILARVCLKMAGYPLNDVSKFADAKAWALKVVQSNIHSLNPSYAQIFINNSADLYDLTSKETLWEIEFAGNNINTTAREGSRFANQFAIRYTGTDVTQVGYGYASVGATGTLFKIYGTAASITDVRRDWCIAPFSYSTANPPLEVAQLATEYYNRDIGKWRRKYETIAPRNTDWAPTNFPVLRYSDVLLMLAEAENELNGPTAALPYFNLVRTRAGASTTYPNGSGLSLVEVATKDQFRNAIMSERARELAFEGLRKMDLIRWRKLLEVLKPVGADITANASSTLKYGSVGYDNAAEKHYLLPIPTLELSLNKSMTQNPGWN
jgi:hypothetical protein